MIASTPSAVFRHPDGWLVFRRPVRVHTARTPAEVQRALRPLDRPPSGGGAVCALAYEAALAFDDALATKPTGALPVAVVIEFGAVESVSDSSLVEDRLGPIHCNGGARPVVFGRWEQEQSREEYGSGYRRVRRELSAGNTYQVNYTHRYRAPLISSADHRDLLRLFLDLARRNDAPHAAFIDTPELGVLSISPELFYQRTGSAVRSKPMKGTAPRGNGDEQDRLVRENLATSPKDRAENLMIVDMIRNDLGRIAEPGSVRVPSLFTVERYPTVHQMTSEVTAVTSVPESELLAALFPCASITGAPKASSMAIISEIEPSPRGFYTGAIGYVLEGRRSTWNVAIRTITIDKKRGRAEYGSGGGIVWDSEEDSEYRELELKARVLEDTAPGFELLETMLCRGNGHVWLLERHLDRMRQSAAELGFRFDELAARRAVAEAAAGASARSTVGTTEPRILRLLLAHDGRVRCESMLLADRPLPDPLPVAVDRVPVDSGDLFLRHKTTYRDVYREAAARHPEVKEVFLVNQRGELTEGTFSTIILEIDGKLVTPAAECGLLPGCYRAELLAAGKVAEGRLFPADLERARAVYAVNSVRGFMRCRPVD